MPNFSILLPPAAGKQSGGNPFAPDMFDYRSSNTFNFFHELNPERRTLIRTLQEFLRAGEGIEDLLGLKGDALAQAVQDNLELFGAPLMSALDRYSPGVMYQSMDFMGLPTGAQRRLLENGIIFSGLFGLLRPGDLIPAYRLGMAATLPGVGKVAAYWREHMSPVLNQALEGRFVWNLLPAIHASAWEDQHTYDAMVTVRWMEEKKDGRVALSHGVKPLRGQLVNFIVRETVEDLTLFEEWQHPAGFCLDAAASTYDPSTKTHTLVMVR